MYLFHEIIIQWLKYTKKYFNTLFSSKLHVIFLWKKDKEIPAFNYLSKIKLMKII